MTITQKLIDDLRADKTQPHILIVEDNQCDAEFLKTLLQPFNCIVTTVGTGEEAIEKMSASSQPDAPDFCLVFADLKLPRLTGIEFLRRMKEANPQLPVVIVTGFVKDEDIFEASKLGYVGVKKKPIQQADLIDIFKKHKLPIPAPLTDQSDRGNSP